MASSVYRVPSPQATEVQEGGVQLMEEPGGQDSSTGTGRERVAAGALSGTAACGVAGMGAVLVGSHAT